MENVLLKDKASLINIIRLNSAIGMSQIPIAFVEFKRQRIFYANHAFYRSLGYKSELNNKLIGSDLFTLFEVDTVVEILNSFENKVALKIIKAHFRKLDGLNKSSIISIELITENNRSFLKLIICDQLIRSLEHMESRVYKQLNLVIEHLADAVWIMDEDGYIQDVNLKAIEELKYTKEELLKMNIEDIDPTLKKGGFKEYFNKVLKEGSISYIGKSKLKDGAIIDVKVSGTTIIIDGQIFYVSATRNITEELKKEQELIDTKNGLCDKINELEEKNHALLISESRNRAIINLIPDMIFIYDVKGNFLDCQTNNSLNLFTPKISFIGKNLKDIMPLDIVNKAMNCIKKTLKSSQMQCFEYSLLIEGTQRYFETRMIKSSDEEVLSIVRDVTALKHEQQVILDLSYKDHLTGLYNRRYLEEMFLTNDKNTKYPVCIMMMDVNGLKLINDAFGYKIGDELLIRVADALREICPGKAILTRIGGDEFVVVINLTSRKEAEELVNILYDDIGKRRVKELVISITIGWELRESQLISCHETFIKAENHMFQKKIVEGQSMRNQTIKAIMSTLNEKNEREKKHSEEVSILSRKIAVIMGFNEQAIKEIEMTGLLHDIGKIVVRDELLNKQGRLTDDEYEEVKKHSESGYQILKSVDAYSSLADDVLAHHERIDGKGYPRGLKGENIPIVARIIAVADAYEAMISDRSYRKGMPHLKAIDEIIRNSGTQFDSDVVKAFVQNYE